MEEKIKMKNPLKRKKNTVETDFINMVRISEIKDMDYTITFYNSYSDKTFVFKVYKVLFDKAMELRKISELEVKTSDDLAKEEKQKTLGMIS